jgi:type IV pilus assembly protein PilE
MRGFTLIELLTCALIASLLTAIALPGYRGVVLRAHRGEARQALLQLQALQERHYLDHLRYSDGSDLLALSDAGRYRLSVQLTSDGQHYTALAMPAPGNAQAADSQCRELSINEAGVRAASHSSCWP